MCGLDAKGSLLDVDDDVDLAVIALPSRHVPGAVDECGRKGTRRVVIISGGFDELGPDGAAIQREITERAREHGIRFIGPNCVGLYNGENGLDTFFQPREAMARPRQGNVAILSQSGTYGLSMMEWLAKEGLGVSKFVSWGNRCDVEEVEMLRYLQGDEGTDVVAIYVEGLRDGVAFADAVESIARSKPVVVMKGGRSQDGARVARSHTASLAGDYAVFRSVLASRGAIVVDDLEEMLDAVKLFSLCGDRFGGRIAAVTNGAGPAVIAFDRLEGTGLDAALLGEATTRRLEAALPGYCSIENPIDLTGSATARWYIEVLNALVDDPGWDVCLILFALQDAPIATSISELEAWLEGYGGGRPIVGVAAGGPFTDQVALVLQAMGVPFYETSKRTMRALEDARRYWSWRDAPMKRGRDAARLALPPMRGDVALDEVESKALLSHFGVPVPDGVVLGSRDQALPSGLGFPVVAKACVPGLLHKTEAQGVVVGIDDAEALSGAVADLFHQFPGGRVLVERMEAGGVEFILGATRDQVFGTVCMAGLGGVYTELFKDVSFRTVPLDRLDAEEMLEELKASRLLDGYRGVALDREALTRSLVSVSLLAHSLGERFEQLDVNPILVREKGVVALDAKIVLKK